MEGYIKLFRKIMDSSVWKNTDTVTVWVWCLLKATHKGYKFAFNGKDIELSPGQFVTGVKQGAEESLTSTMSWRTCIAYLKSTNRISTKSTNKFTIISIVNWGSYQKLTNKKQEQLTNHQQTTNKPATTYKKEENDNNVKKTSERLSFLTSSFNWKRELRKWRAGGGRTVGDYIFTEKDGEQLLMKKDDNGKKIWLTYKEYKLNQK